MHFLLLFSLALGLSADAFAASISNGIRCRGNPLFPALHAGLAFGLSQGAMALLGYFTGHSFSNVIAFLDHWIAFVLLSVLGVGLVLEARKEPKAAKSTGSASGGLLAVQAAATSIDALAVGVGLGVIGAGIWSTALVIALVTFFCCFAGVFLGWRFGGRFRAQAELLGGGLLLLIGLQILLSHLFG